MGAESLVQRLRARAAITHDSVAIPLLREAADALERAEKERDEAHARAGPSAAELNRVLGAPGESFTGRAGCPPKAQEE